MKKVTIFSTSMIVLLILSQTILAQSEFSVSKKSTNDTLLIIKDDGKVGIGTTAPSVELDLRSKSMDNAAGINLGNINDSRWLWLSGDRGSLGPGLHWPEAYPLRFLTYGSGQFNELMRLTGTGYLGIGTQNPGAKLHIAGDTYPNSFIFIEAETGGDAGIRLYEDTTPAWHIYNNPANGGLQIQNSAFQTVIFADQSTGNVGIGTTSPSFPLSVAGTIHSSSGGFRFPDGSVQTSAAGSGAGNTLDEAYDQGGAGAGRTITADAGAFEVGGIDGALFSGTYESGTIPATGSGSRMMWYPGKAAFRAGYVTGTQWDDVQIGNYSISMGYGTIASGHYSTAIGVNNTASATAATALGVNTRALALASTAMGNDTEASAAYSTALGASTTASGNYSMAIGQEIEAQGSHTVAIALSDQNGLQVTQDYTMAIMGGKVGIGTTAPATELEVAGTIQSSSGGFMFPDGSVQTTSTGSGGVISINDLTDGKTSISSIYLGSGAGANDDGEMNENTAVGVNALGSGAGSQNTAFGNGTLSSNTTGQYNTANGYGALIYNTIGFENTANGSYALSLNTTGYRNSANGSYALFQNISGSRNTANGYSALYHNYDGSYNVGLGIKANHFNRDGSQNTIIGYEAGSGTDVHNKSGNVFLGYQSGYNETGDNKLYIENSNSTTPLIGGDFATDEIYLNGRVGIGEIAPTAELQVGGTDGVLFTGTYESGTLPATGEGTRMMWYPAKAAFRAGYVEGTRWDDANIGNYSMSLGNNTIANGENSTAFGLYTTASAYASTAMGSSTTASSASSTAMGYNTTASGPVSTAIGYNTTASGRYSTATGISTEAGGDYSTTMGSYVFASGEGSFVIGDYSTTTTTNFIADNRFSARFANGYRLYTVSGSPWIGAELAAGANSWSVLSDSTKKENIQPVNCEEILTKIGQFKLSTWNYIGQDAANFRHYGPMAQDFFAAFGHDGIGTIGCDTLLSSSDFDGINFIAIQALEKRTSELKSENEQLKTEVALLKSKMERFESLLQKIEGLSVTKKEEKNEFANSK